ncbi:MAG: prepilin-type N-terminal cleavage/methylation domain-containing protein, partial [Desulfuromonadales bacterium]|nr:prepilin-type N-terminal cleavage/methylation domain-containing protein [Desulfuromonadales bacterium]
MISTGKEQGFTLVEVLVALTVTALMLTAVYQTVSSASIAREKLAVESARHHTARIMVER